MQLRKMTLMFAALSAASVLLACPGGGRESLACQTTTDCLESEVCHPQAKVCVETCTTAADCPESAKKCEALSSTDTTLICKCSTTELCARDTRVEGATLSCSTAYSVCTDQTGTTPTKCTANADCAAGQTCNVSTGACEAAPAEGAACSGEGQTTCAYGQYCSSSKCAAVPAPTCANFDPAQGGRTPTFNASTSTGPIIYSVVQSSFAQDTFCGDGNGGTGLTVKARVKAYTTGTAFPAQKSNLPGLFYVRVNGSTVDGSSLILQSGYSTADSGKRAEFVMNFCPGSTATRLSIGLYFTGGNETCGEFVK